MTQYECASEDGFRFVEYISCFCVNSIEVACWAWGDVCCPAVTSTAVFKSYVDWGPCVLLFLKRKANARVSFYESPIEVRESQEYLDVSQIDFVQAQEVDCIRFENTFIQLAQMELAQPFSDCPDIFLYCSSDCNRWGCHPDRRCSKCQVGRRALY